MKTKIPVVIITDDEKQFADHQVQLPSKCPCCQVAFREKPLATYVRRSPHNVSMHFYHSIYFCPHCGYCFFTKALRTPGVNFAEIVEQYPIPEEKTFFSKGITEISPQFVTIYQQAESAENHSLSEICGLGYRKALEFLIKDYCIFLHPDNEEAIQKKFLSNCIKDYIDNPRIKALAEASAWLGNDETHYIRKHPAYSISDLKVFINATVAFIDSELAVIEAEKLLSTPK